MNIKEDHVNELDSFIGPPLHESFKLLYNLSEQTAGKAVAYYREYFSGIPVIFPQKSC